MHIVETVKDGELVAIRFEFSEAEYRNILANAINAGKLTDRQRDTLSKMDIRKVVPHGKKNEFPTKVDVFVGPREGEQ